MAARKTSTYGFSRASKLVQGRIREASETRGFAQTRVLTHWEEIAGADVAAIARPVEVSYSKGGFGGTLTVLTTGANAPLVEMRKEESAPESMQFTATMRCHGCGSRRPPPPGSPRGRSIFNTGQRPRQRPCRAPRLWQRPAPWQRV